ncbi:hypothetical protein CBM2615_B60062 [Cupriavidus taiwanensis]|uniref:Uncharacterized protein n=1 Tax=Cupriavidus taiwanensis TaxID=164546 RepID=A0A976B2V6_9BURK|nr:hypothetical protein CBM2614_B50060 [Cupriavidus taiwanensis]SOZ69704.1 hypothetical protein CBM2615_B60062 [Cupriavidus taiwanensis]SOZ72914.1 hypothetical protein CBM2613_B50062 [Cupriavidus taiwanensis]SPA09772.1 hypothetical protein CBM2625_B50061 [Cupriavidus taiwanensis]
MRRRLDVITELCNGSPHVIDFVLCATFLSETFVCSLAYKRQELTNQCATIGQNLSADQVICLYAVRAFVDWENAGIAQQLLRAGFCNEPRATMHLHTETSDVYPVVREKRLRNGRQERQHSFRISGSLRIGAVVMNVNL